MLVIGVLGLQGSVEEHVKCVEKAEMIPVIVKSEADLSKIDGLILPGGESTTLGLLLKEFNLIKPIKKLIEDGLPTWGTCAGMILLAKNIIGQSETHFSVMDIVVNRNAYGTQLNSFDKYIQVPEVSNNPIKTVFIRAPYIESALSDTQILATLDGKIIAARQRNMLVTSFHPELTDDLSFYTYFKSFIEQISLHDKYRR